MRRCTSPDVDAACAAGYSSEVVRICLPYIITSRASRVVSREYKMESPSSIFLNCYSGSSLNGALWGWYGATWGTALIIGYHHSGLCGHRVEQSLFIPCLVGCSVFLPDAFLFALLNIYIYIPNILYSSFHFNFPLSQYKPNISLNPPCSSPKTLSGGRLCL